MNPSKIKGTAAETAVVNWLRANGFPYAERRALQGALDKGDVSGIPGVCLEIKNQRSMDLGGWLKEMLAEKANSGAKVGAVIHKRRGGTNPADWYATLTVSDLTLLLQMCARELADDAPTA